ncbi:MAG: hypothetical protein K2X01_02315 [Cyanobacteria bacterium]|nr:hypothetical protein [Cyanobacteriota bacterium]
MFNPIISNDGSKLFVRNLSWSITEADLFDLFSSIGHVQSVRIPTRREDGKSRGFAFVEMSTPVEGQSAIASLNGYHLDGRSLSVAIQQADAQRDTHSRSTANKPNACLFIKNVNETVNEAILRQFFESIAGVISVRIPTDRETFRPRGFAFVEMESEGAATQAIQTLNGTELNGQLISITYQDTERKRPSRPFNNNRGHSRGQYSQQRAW